MHSFHIPVMGLAFTVDTPLKVARFGISSVMSIIEDRLIEMMRKHYYPVIGEKYYPISIHEKDYRARRITDYLNLVNRIVQDQIEKVRASAFDVGSDIVRYLEMLPNDNKLKHIYLHMKDMVSAEEKEAMQDKIRSGIVPGSIDVNIMTKVDKNNSDNGTVIEDGSDAVSALRGYAMSELENSSVIFSAGMNPRLFNYMEKLDAFDAAAWGKFRKKVVIKVSDYRSALIQGKYLAKKGIWVSEFRIESGLNCGGHAFATDGYLLGPILEEFKVKREELIAALHSIFEPAARARGKLTFEKPHPLRITVQGGIGTWEEDSFLRQHYNVQSTGWGTPFLLCPEATTVDDETLRLLSSAGKSEVILSKNSPLGIRFHYLKNTSAEKEKENRIKKGKPGSPCTEKHLVSNTEFTEEPVCTASHKYQTLKIAQLQSLGLSGKDLEKQVKEVTAKECLCVGLSNAAGRHYNIPFLKNRIGVTVCPGPNIAYFTSVVSLKEMTDHIYGRSNLLGNMGRPHMFINELRLYIDYLREQIEETPGNDKHAAYCIKFSKNLLDGVEYYKSISSYIKDESLFMDYLENAEKEIDHLINGLQVLSVATHSA